MIDEFKSGSWYIYLGPYDPAGESWNHNDGEMDFIMDRKPHQCNVGRDNEASFFDSLQPNHKWEWNSLDMEDFYEVGKDKIDWSKVVALK